MRMLVIYAKFKIIGFSRIISYVALKTGTVSASHFLGSDITEQRFCVKSKGITEHGIHVLDVARVPCANGFIEGMGPFEQGPHGCNLARIPFTHGSVFFQSRGLVLGPLFDCLPQFVIAGLKRRQPWDAEEEQDEEAFRSNHDSATEDYSGGGCTCEPERCLEPVQDRKTLFRQK